MIIENDYHEVIRVIDGILKAIFETVYQTMTADLTAIRERWPSDEMTYLPETLILEHSEGFQMLRDDGRLVENSPPPTRYTSDSW
jgi:aspartyl-tRNA synthetase